MGEKQFRDGSRAHSFADWLREQPPEQIPQILERTRLFCRLISDGFVPLHWINPDIFFRLPTPDFTIPQPLVTLKVLPDRDSQTSPKLSTNFLDSLRPVSGPLCFEIVSASNRVYLQLSCSESDRHLVERAFAVHFPSVAVLEETALPRLSEACGTIRKGAHAPPTAANVLSLVELCPTFSRQFLRTLSDFAIDPYVPLLEIQSR